MITESSVVVPRHDLMIEGFEDALLVWDETAARLHRLDLLASVVWDELDGRRTVADIAEDLRRDFPEQGSGLSADVLELLRWLVAEDLLAVVVT